MHELSLMESAISAALERAEEEHATQILKIVLRVGTLSGVDPDALRFAFDVVSENTIAAGATLEILEIAVVCDCETCGRFEPKHHDFTCPVSRDHRSKILYGMELEIASMEIR